VTIKEDVQEYKSVIYDGCAIESRGVSLCNLEDVMNTKIGIPTAKYQVWSDGHRFHQLYHNLDEAVEKFLELKKKRKI
tara:strand:- start:825 stop:1058 length:234 start_codon:yes stop_codon:yes gene_type:complete